MAQAYDEDLSAFNVEHDDYTEYRIAHGAGALGGSLSDYLNWHQGILTNKLLNEESVNKMKSMCTLSDGSKTEYGLGIKVGHVKGYKAYLHGGAINGFTSDALYFPALDLTIGFVTNTWVNPVEFRTELVDSVLQAHLENN